MLSLSKLQKQNQVVLRNRLSKQKHWKDGSWKGCFRWYNNALLSMDEVSITNQNIFGTKSYFSKHKIKLNKKTRKVKDLCSILSSSIQDSDLKYPKISQKSQTDCTTK